jgi:outer membrane murein-binding lipoprotein Lpp
MTKLRMTAVLASVVLAGCGVPQSEVDERDQRISTLETQLSEANEKLEGYETATAEMRSKVDEVTSASVELESQVDRLQTENWRDVVGDVQSARDDMVAAKDEAVEGVEELEGQ